MQDMGASDQEVLAQQTSDSGCASSIERFNWAQSIGYPLRGNDLLCAAARVGAVDVVA